MPGGDRLRWQDYLWLLLLSGGCLIYYIFNRKKKRRSGAPRRVPGPLTRREQKAWHKLRESGYSLEEIHPAIPVTMTAGGKVKSFNHEGGFIVSRGGEHFLVRLSPGEGSLNRAGLRRELLLDTLVFQTDGIFFYHEEKGRLEEIRFDYRSGAGGRERFLWRGALILLIIMGILFLGHLLRGSIF